MNRRRFLQMTPAVVGMLGANSHRPAAPCVPPVLWERLLVVDGNSISADWPVPSGPWGAFQTWPRQIEHVSWMIEHGFGVINLAVKGDNIWAMADRAPMGVDTLPRLAQQPYLVAWELTNTLQFWGVLATYNLHVAYCKARQLAGFKVLVGTGISRSNETYYKIPTGFTWADMQQLNDMLRSGWREFADGLVDFAGIPELGGEFSWQSAAMFIDGVHLTDAGSALCKNVVLAELMRQVASSATPTPELAPTATATATAQPMNTIEATVVPLVIGAPTVLPTAAALPWVIPATTTRQPYFLPIVSRRRDR